MDVAGGSVESSPPGLSAGGRVSVNRSLSLLLPQRGSLLCVCECVRV